MPGPSKVVKAREARFAETVNSLDELAGWENGRDETRFSSDAFGSPPPEEKFSKSSTPKSGYDPVMPNVVAEEVIIDVDTVG